MILCHSVRSYLWEVKHLGDIVLPVRKTEGPFMGLCTPQHHPHQRLRGLSTRITYLGLGKQLNVFFGWIHHLSDGHACSHVRGPEPVVQTAYRREGRAWA